MTGKVLDSGGASGALILILPIAAIVVFLLTAWPLVLALFVLALAWRLWDTYQWRQLCKQVDPHFFHLVNEQRGCIVPMDLAMEAGLTGSSAHRFLEKKAQEYGAQTKPLERGIAYYFMTTAAIGNIFDDSDPLADESPEAVSNITETINSTLEDSPTPQLPSASSPVVELEAQPVAFTETAPAETPTISEPVTPITTVAEISTVASPEPPVEQSPEPSAEETMIADPEPITASAGPVEEPPTDPQPVAEAVTPPTSTPETKAAPASGPKPVAEEQASTLSQLMAVMSKNSSLSKSSKKSIGQGAAASKSQTASPKSSDGLTQIQLAKRLELHPSTVGKRRGDDDFAEWSLGKDPDGVSWEFNPETRLYRPLNRDLSELL